MIHEFTRADLELVQHRRRGDAEGAPGEEVDDGAEHDEPDHPPAESSDFREPHPELSDDLTSGANRCRGDYFDFGARCRAPFWTSTKPITLPAASVSNSIFAST